MLSASYEAAIHQKATPVLCTRLCSVRMWKHAQINVRGTSRWHKQHSPTTATSTLWLQNELRAIERGDDVNMALVVKRPPMQEPYRWSWGHADPSTNL